ncbi:MAG: quinone-dependent dihydroorotate dehydrogenase [Candidatus Pacebacteria bacterium]|nr:quinone-dependent dihydroorotate dehydrogenase [Candidatus Paceibacterota bacterium]
MNIYKNLIKPILFKQDPEQVHDKFTKIGVYMGKFWITKKITKIFFHYENPRLEQTYFGIHFKNPVGLSAGFDYNVQLTNILGDVGFGFMSGGTVTFHKYKGNSKPRLKRLPKSQSLLINKGFKSAGLKKVLKDISFTKYNSAKVGISIGATNSPYLCNPKEQVNDILKSFAYLMSHHHLDSFAYFELNISCPNVAGSGVLTEPDILDNLLQNVREIIGDRVLFVKFQAEIDWDDARELVQIMINHNVEAIIVANLLKNKSNYDFNKKEISEIIDNNLMGNFSGKPVEPFADSLISNIYKEFGTEIKIIGVGGIFSAEDAYEKIKRGASLVQLITGIVFEGPSLIGNINKKLVQLLKNDGYTNINEAIGSYYKNSV